MTKEYCPPPPSLPRSKGHRVAAFLRVELSPKIFTSPCPFVRPHAIPSSWPDLGRIHENVVISFIKLTIHLKNVILSILVTVYQVSNGNA